MENLNQLTEQIKELEKGLDTCPEYLKPELTRRIEWKKRQLNLLTPYHSR
jgi:hypothetical protein